MNVHKALFHFLKDNCKVTTNCGSGCPWGIRVSNPTAHVSEFKCMLDTFETEEALVESVKSNALFLELQMNVERINQIGQAENNEVNILELDCKKCEFIQGCESKPEFRESLSEAEEIKKRYSKVSSIELKCLSFKAKEIKAEDLL